MRESTSNTNVDPERLMPGELDALHHGIGSLSHYDLLGVAPNADRLELREAHATLRKRLMSEPLGAGAAVAIRAQIGAVVAAIDEAYEVLVDPARRALYDRVAASPIAHTHPHAAHAAPAHPPAERAALRSSTIPPPAEMPTIPAPPGTTEALVSLLAAPARETPRGIPSPGPIARPREDVRRRESFDLDEAWPLVTEAVPKVEVLPKLSRQPPATPVSEYRVTPTRPLMGDAWLPPRVTPQPMMGSERASKQTGALLTQTGERKRYSIPPEFTTPEGQIEALRRDFATLSGAVELCLEELCAMGSPRANAMRATLGALATIRATHAATAAHMAEEAGHWPVAADQWRRALEAQPTNAHYALCAASAYLRAGTDLDAAAHFAQVAQDLGGGIDTTGVILSEVALRRAR